MGSKTFTFGDYAAGGNVYFRVFDTSGQVLDFDDGTFKSLGSATTPYVDAIERTDMGGSNRVGYQASIDLALVNDGPLAGDFILQAYDGATHATSDDPIGDPLEFSVQFAAIADQHNLIIPQADANVKSTEGNAVQISVWLEKDGITVDVDGHGGTIFTADDTTDVCTANGHGLSDGDALTLVSSATLPAGLAAGKIYYVRDSTANTFKLAASSGGAAIDITDTGTGTHRFRNPTCRVTQREHGTETLNFDVTHGVEALPNDGGTPATISGDVFEFEIGAPNYTDDRGYDLVVTVTIDGTEFVSRFRDVVLG